MGIEELLSRDDLPEDAKSIIRRELHTRQETEEKLRRERDRAEDLINAAPVVILVLDSAGRIVRFNRHLEELSGRTPAETRGEDWFTTFLPERDQLRVRRVFLQVVKNMPTNGTVNSITTRDGREIEIKWYNRTLRDGQGNTIGVLSVGHEVLG